MGRVCLPKRERDRMVTALRQGELSISDLYAMTSDVRRATFQKFLPEAEARLVNAKFEQAMQSTQTRALTNWVKNTISAKDPIRKDMLKRVGRIEKALSTSETDRFLNDLVDMQLGIRVTKEEARQIITMKKVIDETKARWDPKTQKWASEDDMWAYGYALDDFKQYVGDLKLKAETPSWKERAQPKNWFKNIVDAASASKALLATFDLSYPLRQGIKALLRGNVGIWAKSTWTGIKGAGNELVAKAPGFFKERESAYMRMVRAKIFSSPNAMNGKYTAAKNGYELGLLFEEAFPSPLPERLPLLGRLFKASQTAYEASALQMRADLADMFIEMAEKNGIDMLDEVQATAFGKLVGSLTGRSGIGKLEPIGRQLNALLFAPRFLTSNFNTLTAHMFDKSMTPAARREAVKTTLRIASSIAGVLTLAKIMNPDSVDQDPRGSRFGKIKVGDAWMDVTGGMSGLATLGSRLIPHYHNGEFGLWSKSATTGKFNKLSEGGYGQQTAMDVVEQFVEGKFSPGAGLLRDLLRGQDFSGEKVTVGSALFGMTVPITTQNVIADLRAGRDDVLLATLAEGFGASVTRDTMQGYGENWRALKDKVGDVKYNQLLMEYTENYRKKAEKLQDSAKWKKMDNDERNKALDKIKRTESDRIFNKYRIK